jgi:hypothetical protein
LNPEIVEEQFRLDLINVHDISEGMPFVEVVDKPRTVKKGDKSTERLSEIGHKKYCKACIGLANEGEKVDSLISFKHHMSSK